MVLLMSFSTHTWCSQAGLCNGELLMRGSALTACFVCKWSRCRQSLEGEQKHKESKFVSSMK